MLRQRLTSRDTPIADLAARALAVLLALGLIWYGAMLLLLAIKVAPSTVNTLSGYRDAYDYLAGLQRTDIDGQTRMIVAIAGVVSGGLFGYLAWRSLPRPQLTRTPLRLRDKPDGTVEVHPRAIERAVQLAALQSSSITAARPRYGRDEMALDVGVSRASTPVADVLADARSRARRALVDHELPELPVNVTLTRFDRQHRRELQ